ncbi:THAP domaincontaining protein 5like, partial [Caligus rogercresseyi]
MDQMNSIYKVCEVGETMDVKYSMVCSLHFSPQDFREKSVSCSDGKKRQLLRPDAVPSKFPWCGSKPLPYHPPLMNKRNEPAINPEELLSMNNVTCVKDLRERIPKFGLSSNVLMESRGGILTFIHVQRGKT